MEFHLHAGRLGFHLNVEWLNPEETPGLAGLDAAEQIVVAVTDLWDEEPLVRDAALDARRSLRTLQAALAETAEG